MVKNFVTRVNAKVSVGTAAWLLSGSYFVSALLGLFRERLLATNFGIGGTLDAYFVAFSIPDLIFFALTSGALTVTFLPVLSDRLQNYNKKSAWELSSSLLNLLAMVTLVASILIFIFADPLISLVGPGFGAERHQLAVQIMRILALNPFLFAISSVFGSMQQAFGRFFFYALAPVLYNLGIIGGILFLAPSLGIEGVALGAVIGAVLQLVIQIVGMLGLGFNYQATIFWKNHGFRKVLRLIPARSVDEGIEHLNGVIERAIASSLVVGPAVGGAVAAYQYAFTLKNVPINLIGTAIATAIFPKISERANSIRTDLFRQDIAETIQLILWLAVPAATIAWILRGYLVRLLVGSGNVTIANILSWFVIAIIFQSLLRLMARAFYANHDTARPMYVSIGAIIINVISAIILTNLFGITGLAMAQSLVAVLEVLTLVYLLRRKIGQFIDRSLILAMVKIAAATGVLVAVSYGLVRYVFPLLATDRGFFILAPKFGAIVGISLIAYVIVSYWLQISQARIAVNAVGKTIFREIRIEE